MLLTFAVAAGVAGTGDNDRADLRRPALWNKYIPECFGD
jgi:hypothetical protein